MPQPVWRPCRGVVHVYDPKIAGVAVAKRVEFTVIEVEGAAEIEDQALLFGRKDGRRKCDGRSAVRVAESVYDRPVLQVNERDRLSDNDSAKVADEIVGDAVVD